MPSKSKKQHNFMEAIAHNPAFAKKAGVSQKVGQEYSKADKGKTFRKGGIMFKGKETYKEELAEGKAVKSGKLTPAQYAKGESKEKTAKKEPYKEELAEGKALKSGKVSPEKYAKEEGKEKKFAMGGYMGGATLPNQQFPMQQQAPQNTMLNAPQAPQAPGTPGMPYAANNQTAFKKGGAVKKMAPGGMSTAMIGNDEDGQALVRGNNGLPAKPTAVKKEAKVTTGAGGYGVTGTPEEIERALSKVDDRGRPMKKGGAVKKMNMGGSMDPRIAMMAKKKAPMMPPARGMMPPMAAPQVAPTMPMKKGGKVKGQSPIQTKAKGGAKIVKMAKGGLTSSRGDGCAIRGKTRA